MEQAPAYHSINFSFAAVGPQGTISAGAINSTGLRAKVRSYICPSDSKQLPSSGPSAYTQCSYAGMVGTIDIFRWECGCPVIFKDGVVCVGQVELMPDGAFGNNYNFSPAQITDGLSSTILLGEFARFPHDPDVSFNEWTSALYYASVLPGVSRPQGLATSVPRINAGLRIPDYPASSPTGWKNDRENLNLGQFGFRSPHPGGAEFLFGDGSVHWLKQTINTQIYRALSTRAGCEVIGSDSY
jgi:prepilin-type processing-associated H-X9-DG protein